MHVVIQIQALRRKSKKLKSLLSRKKQRSKKIKALYNCILDQILSGTHTETY